MNDSLELAAALFKQLARSLDSLTPEDRDSILRGESTLRLVVEPKQKPKRSVVSPTEDFDIETILSRLGACQSREEARRVMEDLGLSKSALRQLTKVLDLPSQKDDSVPRFIDRIIEGTVGFRLRSHAIQGRDDTTLPRSAE